MLCVVTAGRELRLSAKIRRFNWTLSSSDRRCSGEGSFEKSLVRSVSGDCSLVMSEIIPIRTHRHVKQPCPNPVLDFGHGILKLLRDGLTFQRIDGVRVCLSRRDNKCDNGNVRTRRLQAVIKTRKSLDEHVKAFVSVLVAASRKHVEGVLEVKVDMPVKVTAYELVDLLLRR